MSEKKSETLTEKKVSRRSMLKWTGALAAAAAVGAVAEYGASELMKPVPPPPPPPVSFKPPLSPEIQQRVDAIKQQLISIHAGETSSFYVCSSNGCNYGPCTVKARVKNGVVTALDNLTDTASYLNKDKGLREDVPEDQLKQMMVNQRPCVRGFLWRKSFYDPNHAMYPMKLVPGTNSAGQDKYVRISWDEALDTVASQIKQVMDKRGYYSIHPGVIGMSWLDYLGPYAVADWGMSTWSGNHLCDLVTTGQQCWGVKPGGSYFGDTIGSPDHPLFLDTKLMVFVGWNPALTYYGMHYWVTLAQEKGIPLVVIDPVYSMTARQADQWIPIRPGTDMALLAAMANVLFKEDLYDHDFVNKFVEPNGFQMWKDYILGNTAGPDGKIDRTPEWAANITGIPAQTIVELTRLVAKTKPSYFRVHVVATRQLYGENAARAAAYFVAMIGQTGYPGQYTVGTDPWVAGWMPTPYTNMQRAKLTYPRMSYENTHHWQNAVLFRDDVDSGKMSEAQFRQIVGQAKDWPLANIRLAEFKLGQHAGDQDQNRGYRAFRKLDFAFSPLCNMKQSHVGAKILLPLADYLDGYWRTYGGAMNYALAGFKSVKRAGEAKDVEWINIQLAKRFNVADKYSPLLLDALDDENKWDTTMDKIMQAGYEAWTKNEFIATLNPPSYADFKKSPIFYAPRPASTLHAAWQETIQKGQPFETNSGKIEFYSEFIASGDVSDKSFVLPKRGDQYICFGGTKPPKIPPIAQWVTPINQSIGRDGAKYPLQVLHGGPRTYRNHMAQDSNQWALDEYRHAVWLSVADAKARGIKDGDTVRIFNDNGESVVPAYVTSRITPGVVHISFGGWPQFSSLKTPLSPEGVDTRGATNILTRWNPEGWVIAPVHCSDVVEVEKL
jgi:anaerobic dimethyl sulfoxide reductase subunit A